MSSRRSPNATDRMTRPVRWLLVVCGLAWLGYSAPATADDAAFDSTLRQLAGLCLHGPATDCAARFFALADADGDGRADAGELGGLDARLRLWTSANADTLQPEDLRALRVGFLLVDTIGIERGIMLYDNDGDRALSLDEATADLILDQRPLPRLVQEQALVDWPAVRQRLGVTAMLFDYLNIR